MTVITTYVHPPIPVREFDWSAVFEQDEENPDAYGWGDSEAAALIDLIDKTGEQE